ncbi:MAG: diguanylate cyclase [Planctomycetota bacterium]|nr:diguanylate cyclase [Planctomycetota bacterium]
MQAIQEPPAQGVDLTALLTALTALKKGDFSVRLPLDWTGVAGKVADTFNDVIELNERMSDELERISRVVGKEGKINQRATLGAISGSWGDSIDSVNALIGDLVHPTSETARVIGAVALGDLSQTMALQIDARPLQGEFLRTAKTINTMVDQLSSFASEVTRVAREVGTEGKLGGQAQVKGVSGTWKDLTDNVNFMAGNLTSQVRGIAKVVTAVANGDLKQKLTVEAKGEIAALADTINSMIDTLATFADQVTSVAREVGVEGKLGGQASVPGAAGTWKDLTDNVNQLAANLTTQVRAIAEVATAVTKGDLTRSIKVEALGEVAVLKDNINEMIRNLKDTTLKNSEQDWLKTNLAKFSRMLQGQKDLLTVGRLILSELAPVVSAQQAVFYILDSNRETPHLSLLASYAHRGQNAVGSQFALGEGLVGQCAIEKQKILLANVPPDYIRISSGLGDSAPHNIIVLPVVFEGQVKGVLELASFERFNPTHQAFLDQLTESIGIVLNTIEANMRTEDLLKQSQSLAHELQSRQEELQQTNQELQEKALLLAHQNQEVERKNQEVEQARQALEEKAKQLALTSKYKSEFLANMSHELRTPLNSLLILSDQLSKNPEGNLSARQTEFAKTIHSSGNDLLMLINDILDLSKIESGTVVVDVGELQLSDLHNYVERTFRHVAESKGVDFLIELRPGLPRSLFTDAKRLQQVIKNLLSNAFKFTHQGKVSLTLEQVRGGWNHDNEDLNRAPSVLAISVADTGIGISPDKQQIIFEAFQQADGSTSRKYGGTGLGLAISREISRLLGGEIRLSSTPGRGSSFTLYLPQSYVHQKASRRAGAITGDNGMARTSLTTELAPTVLDAPHPVDEVGDDRGTIQPGDPLILIVENDLPFAKLMLEAAREKGFKGLVTSLGAAALAMTREYKPDAVTLDICLPDIDGWRVIERLKNDINTRHIPVYVVSTEESHDRALSYGAISFAAKPFKNRESLERLFDDVREFVGRRVKDVVVVADDAGKRDQILMHIGSDALNVTAAANGEDALELLAAQRIDCIVLASAPTDMTTEDFVRRIRRDPSVTTLPVILYSDEPDAGDEATLPRTLASSITLRQVRSLERLVDQTSLFLHEPITKLPEPKRRMIEGLYQTDRVLAGKKVLIVDDDIRNIFALTSILDWRNMVIVSAETGRGAIEILQAQPDVDVVLMDIMMPEMDGIDTMRAIRKFPKFSSLPIIAVTAKAMKGDREKCIEAGAWDYLSKPVDTEQLLSVLRAWLHR